jgi:hypothetical protein
MWLIQMKTFESVGKKTEIVLYAATGTAASLQHGIPDTVEK